MGLFDIFTGGKKKAVTNFSIQIVNGRVVITSNTGKKQYIDQGFLKSARVYSVVSMLARKFASFPVYTYTVKDEQALKSYLMLTKGDLNTPAALARAKAMKKKALEEADESNELARLLKRPNSRQGQDIFWELLYTFKLLTGDGFIYFNRGDWTKTDGKIYSMHVLPSHYMGITGDGSLNGIKDYQLQLSKVQNIPPENILQWSYPNPDYTMSGNHLFGLSPLKAATTDLLTDNEASNAGYSLMKNGGAAKLLTRRDQFQFTPEQSEDLRLKIEDEVQGSHNRGKLAVTNAMVDVVSIGMSGEELQLVQMLGMTADTICNVYGVDPILFSKDASTYNNKLLAGKNLVNNKLMPEWSGLRDELNRMLVPVFFPNANGKVFIDYDVSDLPEMQQDQKDMIAALEAMWWTSPNEKRVSSDYEPRPEKEMDEIYIPTGYESITSKGELMPDDEITDDEEVIR